MTSWVFSFRHFLMLPMSAFPYSSAEITDFLRLEVLMLLARLSPAQPPAWGQLTPQHMVEHLAGATRLSMGRHDLPAPLTSLALDRMRAALLANAPFPAGIRNPMMPATPGPLRLPSLVVAIAELRRELEAFFEHYARQPAATAVHPMFGTLDFGQWRVFHFKHFSHHLFQFGLLAGPLLPRPVEAS